MATFGERLRERRTELRWTLEELAALLKTDKQVLSRYENEVRVPEITVLPEYARVLGVNLLWLIGFDDVSKFSDIKRDTVDITEYTPTKRAIIHSVGKLTEEDAEAIEKLLGRLNDDGGNQ